MAYTKVYKLYASTVANAEANLQIGQPGRITSVNFDMVGVAAAATTGAETHELALNSGTYSLATNDSVTAIASCTISNNIASSACNQQKLIAGLSIPVNTGDRLYLNGVSLAGSTNLTSRVIEVYVYVEQ